MIGVFSATMPACHNKNLVSFAVRKNQRVHTDKDNARNTQSPSSRNFPLRPILGGSGSDDPEHLRGRSRGLVLCNGELRFGCAELCSRQAMTVGGIMFTMVVASRVTDD